MHFRKRLIILPILFSVLAYMLFAVYAEVRRQTINDFNTQQMLMAKQAAKSVEKLFQEYQGELSYLADNRSVIFMSDEGKDLLKAYYLHHQDNIRAVTRVDAKGKIVYTVPMDKNIIGNDISYQDHVAQVIKTHEPVVSDVFMAVQDYQAIAYHIPVFDGDKYAGSLALLIPFENISEEYFQNIKTAKNGYAWVITQKGIEISCPITSHIGRSIYETSNNFPSLVELADKMIKGEQGVTTYSYNKIMDETVEQTKKHAVYYPIHLGNTIWSICIATPESDVLATMKGFRDKLFLIIILLLGVGLAFTYYFMRAWIVLSEEHKRIAAEKALKESEARYRLIVENSHDGIIIVDDQFKFEYVNQKCSDMIGYPVHKIIGSDFRDYLTEDCKAEVASRYKKRQAGEEVPAWYNLKIINSSGQIRTLEISSAISKDAKGRIKTIAQLLDITEKNEAAEALRRSEERFREMADLLPQVIFETDLEGNLTFVNRIALQLFGYTKEDFEQGTNAIDMICESDRERAKKNILEVISGNEPDSAEYTALRKDGSTFSILIYSDRIFKGDQVTGLRGILVDITERKTMEEALRKSEEQFRNYVNSAPDGIFLFDNQLKFIDTNKGICRITGKKQRQLLKSDLYDLILKSDHTNLNKFLHTLIKKKHAIGDFNFIRTDGTKGFCTIDAVLFSEERYLGFIKDITQRKTLEEQFRQSQKMEAIGQLAGGIAHDFNNLLTIINGYSEMILGKFTKKDITLEGVQQILKAGKRAEALTRQLLAFSRKQILQPKILNLNHLVKDLETMLSRLIGENIELETRYADNLLQIKADPGQLEQVILNLVINARDAMPSGGNLNIETANVYLDSNYVKTHPEALAGMHAMLAITDNGTGMDTETLSHIFDPFFTTKEEGTGLGLSTVYGIIRQSGGTISVYSEPGAGTTFKIYLKVSDEEAAAQITKEDIEENFSGTESILVVEDESAVRKIAVMTLDQAGYKVFEAADGQEAIKFLENNDEGVDLVLTDVIMPGIGGKDVAEKMQEFCPNTKLIFMSGYTNNAIVHHGVLDDKTNFIQKPFTPISLLKKIRDVIDLKTN
jgi:two-component system cell cycle sensor histidine kinase/response regulator CckA